MADVCRTRGGALSPLSPNESRKRSRGSTGAQSSWFKRHRTGHSFARRLLHLRGFALDVRQAEELVRFIDQFPPEMDKDVSNILEKCGDIDDAVRQLTTLRLSAAAAGPADGADAGAKPSGSDPLGGGGGSTDATADAAEAAGASAAGASAAGASTAGASIAEADPGAALSAAEAAARAAAAASAASARLERAAPTTLSSEWVAALVREMGASSDVPDAHARAERVLQAFEATVRGSVAGASGFSGADRGGAGAGGEDGAGAASGGDPNTLARENVILKRAVAIQNARQQEHEATRHQIVELQRAVLSYQERLQNAERQNYSLGVHLKEAMGARGGGHGGVFDRNPDVF